MEAVSAIFRKMTAYMNNDHAWRLAFRDETSGYGSLLGVKDSSLLFTGFRGVVIDGSEICPQDGVMVWETRGAAVVVVLGGGILPI